MKITRQSSQQLPASTPRKEARQSKLRALTPVQSESLKRWLVTEKLTYAQAGARLLNEFGVSLSAWSLSAFWHRFCAAPTPTSEVLLDVVIQSAAPVRLIINRKSEGVSLSSKACKSVAPSSDFQI